MVKLQNGNKLRLVFHKFQFKDPLVFSVYINDLPEELTSSVKLFVDDTSIFSVVHDSSFSSLSLNEYLPKISQWGCKWKMLLNPDTSKQAKRLFSHAKKILLTITTSTQQHAVKQKIYSKTSRAIFRC